MINTFLGLRPSASQFIVYPHSCMPFDDPYGDITLDVMHTYFFQQDRAPGMVYFPSTDLRVQEYVLYRVVVNCILPLSTKNLNKMRPFHSFILYAFTHRLELDLGLLMFHTIVYAASVVTSRRVHMPYCHILTGIFGSLGVDTTIGEVTPLRDYDSIGSRQITLGHIEVSAEGRLSWRQPRIPPPQDQDQDQDQPQPDLADVDVAEIEELLALPDAPAPPPPMTTDQRLDRMEGTLQTVIGRLDAQSASMAEILQLVRALQIPPPPPPP